MGEKKNPKWNEEMWKTITPPENIQCKDCIFRLKPLTVAGETMLRHTYGNCNIFKGSQMKPREVLWEGESCEYYEQEKRKR